MTLFKEKYRIESARLEGWDYSSPGAYFVTIVTKNKECYLGDIKTVGRDVKSYVSTNNHVSLSEIGKIARQFWLEIPKHFPFVSIDKFVIMPNHIHGIVIINKSVETQNLASLQTYPQNKSPKNTFGPQSKNLASIIRGFKTGVTKYAKNKNIPFQWQSRYYDHVIRNEKSLKSIRQYIIDNPSNWFEDKDNPDNLRKVK